MKTAMMIDTAIGGLLLVAATFALTELSPARANSASNYNPNAPGAVAKSQRSPRPEPPRVEKVNSLTEIISVKQGNSSVVYSVDSSTKIVVNGKPGKLADIKPGMPVSVSTGADKTKASKIEAGSSR